MMKDKTGKRLQNYNIKFSIFSKLKLTLIRKITTYVNCVSILQPILKCIVRQQPLVTTAIVMVAKRQLGA